MDKTVVELFAGVGGFRVGLNNIKHIDDSGLAIENGDFRFVWANQWEPSTKIQHAFDCYQKRFGVSVNHSNEDISKVDKTSIPNHTLLVGGFPCQDYSVARSLSNEKGIEGKKGVLWWEINEILKVKRPPFVLLENVDRLIKSPSKQRGRDFGIMLRCFHDLGYGVEWRVVNAADYGHPQRRRRIYIFAFHNTTRYYKAHPKLINETNISVTGMFQRAFPIATDTKQFSSISIDSKAFTDIVSVSNNLKFIFENHGFMIEGAVYSHKSQPIIEQQFQLRTILQDNIVDEKIYITNTYEKFSYLKNSKKILRQKNNVQYYYSEGAISFPDKLDLPARTMLTSEGSVNRSTHVIQDNKTNKLRLLTPIEAERINEFPDNWTNSGMPSKRRYFMMGNALVCGIISKIGNQLSLLIDNEL